MGGQGSCRLALRHRVQRAVSRGSAGASPSLYAFDLADAQRRLADREGRCRLAYGIAFNEQHLFRYCDLFSSCPRRNFLPQLQVDRVVDEFD